MKKLIRLTESDLHSMIKESVISILEAVNTYTEKLIEEVLLNGGWYNLNNDEGYAIGIGYGCGTKKDFFSPYSSRLEYSYCIVTVEDIENIRIKLEERGYVFDDDNGYVHMVGKIRDSENTTTTKINPNSDPVGYYSDRLFKNSTDGNLHLF